MSRDDDDRRSRRDDDDRRSSRDRDDRGRDRDRGRDDDRRGSRDRDDDPRGRSRDDDSRGGTRSRYEYKERGAEGVEERTTMGGQDYDKLLKPGIKMFKPRDRENRIRILPPTWDGAKHFGLDVYVHYGVGPDRASYICPNKHGGRDCPVCAEREEARRDNNADEKYIKDLEAKRRVLIYLVDREDERTGEQAWFMPWTLDKEIAMQSIDKETREVLPIDSPAKGYDVIFDKSGTKDRTKYEGVQIARRSSPLGRDAWLDNAMDKPLPDQIIIHKPEQIAKAFGAQGVERDRRGSARDDDHDDRGRDRDRDRDRDDRSSRDRDRDDRGSRDRDRDSERTSRREDDEPTWGSVHKMTRTELEDLIELKDLPIKPRDAKDDDDLADWVCEELKLKEPARRERMDDEPARGRTRDDDRGSDDRLREMRRRREE